MEARVSRLALFEHGISIESHDRLWRWIAQLERKYCHFKEFSFRLFSCAFPGSWPIREDCPLRHHISFTSCKSFGKWIDFTLTYGDAWSVHHRDTHSWTCGSVKKNFWLLRVLRQVKCSCACCYRLHCLLLLIQKCSLTVTFRCISA